MRQRWTAILAVGVTVALATGACTSSKPQAASTPAAASDATAPASTPAGATPAPSTYKVRPAAWTPCNDLPSQMFGQANNTFAFDCATIQVPQDWHNPDNGKVFDVAIVRARSKAQKNRIGSLLVNPGGPGGSGIQLAVSETFPGQLPTAVTDRFDLIGFDPRGVGKSTEVSCIQAAKEDALFAADPDPKTQAQFDAVVALNKSASAPCGAKYGAQLPLFSTDQAARDMDAIRQAVGNPKLTYLGYSYGTLLGAVYAQLFPQNVRALVLDGTIDPKQDLVARSEGQAGGFEHAFNDFAVWCKQNAAKCPIGPDARASVVAALDKARTAPVKNADGREATAGWIFTGVAEAMYSKSEWEPMAQAIAALGKGNSVPIFKLADEYAERSPNGSYTNLFDDNDAVNCADFAHQPTVAQVRQYQSEWRKKYPLFGAPLAVGLLTCASHVWPGTYDPYPTGPATGAAPIVVIGTTGDPATPYAQTARLASMLGNGHVVTWDGEGHTAYPQTTCITNAVDDYLVNLTVPKAGLTCPATS